MDKIIKENEYPIILSRNDGSNFDVTADGRYFKDWDGDCTLFPSKEQRDWRKFSAPWYKKDKFDPNNLQPYDKVLVRDGDPYTWRCAFFSHKNDNAESGIYKYATSDNSYVCCIPYNGETKYLVGTEEEAPEYYRYWED